MRAPGLPLLGLVLCACAAGGTWLGETRRGPNRTRVPPGSVRARPNRPAPLSPAAAPRPTVPARPELTVSCGEAEIRVELDPEYLGKRVRLRPESVRLGSCPAATGNSAPGTAIVITAKVHDCGAVSRVTADALIYYNELLLWPPPAGGGVEHIPVSTIPIECRYRRKKRVSGGAVVPTWRPFTSTRSALGQLDFSLTLLTEGWGPSSLSTVFFLGEQLWLEAAVSAPGHTPLRLLVDRCVATVTPDPGSSPRYTLVDHRGCLVDGRPPGSSSLFRRTRPDALLFTVQAFRFLRDVRDQLYLTCHLRAIPAHRPPDPLNKACHFSQDTQSWVAVEGGAKLCSCCETGVCSGARRAAHLPPDAEGEHADRALGPLVVLPHSRRTASSSGRHPVSRGGLAWTRRQDDRPRRL
ncbi:zona pellucida sperm-binding protein 3 [Amia ocellicauda]|uniref:zona pellucida sperm-binding protein 3 n=1 Tax=Amia ocellicauda TaxID=2972642 RepID=UPI003464B4B3